MQAGRDRARDSWWPPKRAIRRLYDWTLHWADTRFGTPALTLLAFAESSFFPVPTDLLLIALSAGRPRRAFFYAAIATVFSVAGGVFGYLLGALVMDSVGQAILDLYQLHTQFEWVQDKYRETAFLSVFTAGLTPIPYKVFTLAAGAVHLSMPIFVGASLAGRGMRYFLVAGLLYFFGAPVRTFIEKYLDRLAIAFVVLLIGSFLVVRFLFR